MNADERAQLNALKPCAVCGQPVGRIVGMAGRGRVTCGADACNRKHRSLQRKYGREWPRMTGATMSAEPAMHDDERPLTVEALDAIEAHARHVLEHPKGLDGLRRGDCERIVRLCAALRPYFIPPPTELEAEAFIAAHRDVIDAGLAAAAAASSTETPGHSPACLARYNPKHNEFRCICGAAETPEGQ